MQGRKQMVMREAIEDDCLHNAQSALLVTDECSSYSIRRQENNTRSIICKDVSCRKISCKQGSWWHGPAPTCAAKKRARQGTFCFVTQRSKDATYRSLDRPKTNRVRRMKRVKTRSVDDLVPRYGLACLDSKAENPWQEESTRQNSCRVEGWVMETLKLGIEAFSGPKRQRNSKSRQERGFVDHDNRKGCSISFIIAEVIILVACFAFFLLIFGVL